jgi:cytidyltransferase-like protein
MKVGSVHGRFQPFHNAHLEYVLAALQRCDHLLIGITKYEVDPVHWNLLGTHRDHPTSNPLSYVERTTMIREALVDVGHSDGFDFVPFPIDAPVLLPQYVTRSVICYTTICEEWNRKKIQVLQDSGYQVEVLWEREPKLISASDIRSKIKDGLSGWHEQVPLATARAVANLDLRARLQRLAETPPRE